MFRIGVCIHIIL